MALAWAAGFLDGEGYFSIYARGSAGAGKKRDHNPRALVRAAQAGTREPLDKLQDLLGGSICQPSRLTSTGKTVWAWQWQSASSMREYLPLIIPHMVVKNREAQVVLRFAQLIRTRGSSQSLSDEQRAERFALADELVAIRKEGRSHRP